MVLTFPFSYQTLILFHSEQVVEREIERRNLCFFPSKTLFPDTVKAHLSSKICEFESPLNDDAVNALIAARNLLDYDSLIKHSVGELSAMARFAIHIDSKVASDIRSAYLFKKIEGTFGIYVAREALEALPHVADVSEQLSGYRRDHSVLEAVMDTISNHYSLKYGKAA